MRDVLSSIALGILLVPVAFLVLLCLLVVGVLLLPLILVGGVFAAIEAWRN